MTVYAVVTYYLVAPDEREVPSYLRGDPLTKFTHTRRQGLDNEGLLHIFHRYDVIATESTRYIVLASLGAGTYGQVFRCQDMVDRNIVAIKVMRHSKKTGMHILQKEQRVLKLVSPSSSTLEISQSSTD